MINKPKFRSLIQSLRQKNPLLFEALNTLLDEVSDTEQTLQDLITRVDDETLLLKYAFRATHDADQAAGTSGTDLTLAFNTDRWNYGHMHDETTNNTRGIVLSEGRYKVGCNVRFAANATGIRLVKLVKTDLAGTVTILNEVRHSAASAGSTVICFEIEDDFLRGDYVEVIVNQTSGGSLNIETQANFSPEFWMQGISNLFNL